MKKFFILTLISSSLAVFAQEQYKPEKGSFTTELQFNPFGINTKIDAYDERIDFSTGPISMDGLKLRYFVSEKIALRLALGLNFDQNSRVREIDDTEGGYYYQFVRTGEFSEENSHTTFSVATGFEYHFGNFERLSVYLGGEVLYGSTTTRSKISQDLTRTGSYTDYDYWDEFIFQESTKSTLELKNCSYYYGCCGDDFFQNAPVFFGGNIVLGMDFYVYKGLYLGVEFGFGYTHSSMKKGSYKRDYVSLTTINGSSSRTEDSIDKKLGDKITSNNIGFRYSPMIRLGWRF